ncbi:MAG: polysaccharide biosynthesis tyrosine autokinase [Synechococcales bacterium]|nr:polysaccharide biosynthesis tyrosine autokinase [Synechococcales bacterium]
MSKSLSRIRSILRRRGWIALPTLASITGASLLYLAITPQVYQTSAQIIVGTNKVSVSDLGQQLNEGTTRTPGQADPIATQAELVKSQGVLQTAIEDVKRQFEGVTTNFPSAFALRQALSVEILPLTNIIKLSVEGENPEVTAALTNAIAEAALADNIEIIRREASVVREFLEGKIPQNQAELRQAEAAEANYRRSSGIVDPQAQIQQLIGQISNLEVEEDQLVAQIQEARTRDRQLQQVTGAVEPTAAYERVRAGQDAQLQELQTQITALGVEMAEARTRLGDQHPDWLALVEEEQQLQDLYNTRLSALISEGSSQIAQDELTQGLFSQYIQARIDLRGLESRLASVQTELSALRVRLSQFPQQQQPLADLVRRRQESEASLDFLQSKLEEARLAEAQLISSVRIIGRAEVPINPIGPKPAVVFVLGAFIWLALTSGLIVLLEVMDNRLRTTSDAEETLKLPVLGILPKLPHPYRETDVARLVTFLGSPDLVEPYRALLNALSSQGKQAAPHRTFYNNGSNHNTNHAAGGATPYQQTQIVVVTSPFPKEGKSAVALYLAATAAASSQRTLLIDADLLSEAQSERINLPTSPELMDVLDTPDKLSEVVEPTGVSGLSILSHNPQRKRSSMVLGREAIRKLLDNARVKYDWVIIDTAPAGLCADAAALSQFADGLLLVIRSGVSQREAAIHVATELKKSGVPILGLALNGADASGSVFYTDVSDARSPLPVYSN